MPRVRTAKTLAKRIDLQYFTRLRGFRRWRLVLSIIVPLVAVGWLLGERAPGNHAIYSSGPVSSAHAVFGQNCGLCHVRSASFSASVNDTACLACHSAPIHNTQQAFTPACSSCHLEHKGKFKMAETADAACSQCHADLHVRKGEVKFDPHVSDFDNNHPQFLAVRRGQYDRGTVNLNHHAHLQPTLRGPDGPLQMQCNDCHRPVGINQPWPYSITAVQAASQQPVVVSAAETQEQKRRLTETGAGPYMAPIKYVNQCAACHTLQFDPLISRPAPHDKPEIVRAFIVEKIKQLVQQNPDLVHKSIATGYEGQIEAARSFLRPTRDFLVLPKAPTTPLNWVAQRTEIAERLLWRKDCKICHSQTTGESDRLPTSVKAVIPARWLPYAEFDHQAHRMMTCESCHSHISESNQTADVNLPGIETCRRCHKDAGMSQAAAEGRCYECHSYHAWKKEQPLKGTFNLDALRAGN